MSLRPSHPDVVAYQVSHPDFIANTLASLRALIHQGVKHFMFDVQACAGGNLVLLHDLTMDTPDGHSFVQYTSLETLSEVDLGSGQRVLTLFDALDYLPEGSEVFLRVVGRHTLYPLLRFLDENPDYIPKKLWFVSGDQMLLHTLHNKVKSARCASLMSGMPVHDLNVLLTHGIHAVIVAPQDINPYLVHELQNLGIELWVKDVAACSIYQRCLDWSARKIVSNQPSLLAEMKNKGNCSDLLTH